MTGDVLGDYKLECVAALESVDLDAVQSVVEALLKAREIGGTVFVAGNGGSAATASHMATDLMLGSQLRNPSLRVISIVDNQAVITATGNDLGFEEIFARQLRSLARDGDILISVSASGNSPDIIRAAVVAKELGMLNIGLTGFTGGKLRDLVDICVHVPTRVGAYGPVEDVHLAVNHMITEALKLAGD